MSKIILRVKGGLGNQLFGFAAARRLALVRDAELILDDQSGFVRDHVYRRHYQLDHFTIPCRKATAAERLEPFSLVRRYLMRKRSSHQPFGLRAYIQQEGVDFDHRLLAAEPRGTVYLDGYWQSESYFKDVEKFIRQDLRIRPPTDARNALMAERILAGNAVAIHVRFFDAPGRRGDANVPRDYYQRAVETMENIAPGAVYYLFSDQVLAAREIIPLPSERVVSVDFNRGDEMAYADLWLMSQCRHFIIANSTFSWWGAWLSAFPQKSVIAPGCENPGGVGAWGFRGLIPDEWVRL